MKTKQPVAALLVSGMALLLVILWSSQAYSQETTKKDSKNVTQKKVIVKVISDDNGTRTVIDTTLDMPDSAMLDSIRNEVDKVIELGRGGRARIRMHGLPEGYSYDFDIPELPDCPMRLGDLDLDLDLKDLPDIPGYRGFAGDWTPARERRIMRMLEDDRGQSLNDLLGDIPMDRVKNYSIKETKNGKKITIELENGPVVERRDKVIIIREPARPGRYGRKAPKQKQVKVYVNPEKGDIQEAPEPPPPPPPPKK